MRAFAPIALASLILLSLIPLRAETELMPLSEIRPGMTGVGITVFDGSAREEFTVHILGVLRNVMGPRRNIIVARLEGGPLAETGVIQGMSGSPVYIDGRLIGAVSYSLGSFPKEPIAGLTPIEEMVESDSAPTSMVGHQPAALRLPVTQGDLRDLIRQAFRRVKPFSEQPSKVQALGLNPTEAGRLGTLLRPIATPLALTGFVPELHDFWKSEFNGRGFVTAVGSSAVEQEISDARLKPGDSVGASLIRGDFAMTGTGTVTMVEGDRVYAFGHPFYNLGPTRFPMTRATITALLPSLATSSKIAAIGDVLGTFDQDRSTGIFGTLGPSPKMVPVTIFLESSERNLRQTFKFEIVDNPLFTPLLTYVSVLNTFRSWTQEVGATTYLVKGRTQVQNRADVLFNDIYTGTDASLDAAAAIAAPLVTLLANDFAPVTLNGLDITITSVEEPRTATLQRVWLDASRLRAGDTVPLKVLSRTYGGADVLETVMVEIPPNASGRLQILVSDATQLTQRERQQGRAPGSAQTLDQMIQALNDVRRNNRLYVRLLQPTAGAVVNGEILSSLPLSVLAVLEGDRSGGGLVRLHEATLREWQIQTDFSISGFRLLTLDVEAG
jgi:hypothetical protein